MEYSLILIKPDAIQREKVGEVISRIESKGLKIVGLKMMQLTEEQVDDHYSHLTHLAFYPEIKNFMRSTPIIAMCVRGVECVTTMRLLAGKTLSRAADQGSIRGDLAMSIQCNLIHASDSTEAAKQEVERFFSQDEIFEYQKVLDTFIYSPGELSESNG